MKKFLVIFSMGIAFGIALMLVQPDLASLAGFATASTLPIHSINSTSVSAIFSPGTEQIFVSALRSAQKEIVVEMYVFTSKPLRDELLAARARGVVVKVILEPGVDDNKKMAAFLKDNGIDVRWASSHFDKTHSKFFIIDNSTIFVGSHNWTFHALNLNREASVKITSVEVARDFVETFYSDWSIATAAS